MKSLADRRTMLLSVGTAVAVAVAGAAPAHSVEISGTVEFEGGAAIPKGEIEIHIEDPTVRESAQHGAAETRVASSGKSRTIEFSFSLPSSSTASPGSQIIARLERADGWLLARGSAQLAIDAPVYITLYTAMY